ncbi:MAG: type II toxin-antitoxin system VapC family toxin [Rhodoferax sp.]
MIILDTNVVSEPLKQEPVRTVLEWLDAQAPETLFLTSITLAELYAGIESMPTGRRKTELSLALLDRVVPLFEGRILVFDSKAAQAFARVNAKAQSAGNPIGFADGAIAAIAAANSFCVATRNVKDFKGTGVEIINPWDGKS